MRMARLWLERGTGQNGRWSDATRLRYERIVRRQIDTDAASGRPIGACKLRDLTVDRVALWSASNERLLAPTTAKFALITLGQVCRYAVRLGWLADNPVAKLEPSEKPHWTPKAVDILEGEQLARFLAHAKSRRPLFEFLAHTGLRIGEALGLTWADIHYDQAGVQVHRQLNRHREFAPLKTPSSRRTVDLAPSLVLQLRERWLASRYKGPTDFVFGNRLGRGMDYRDVGNDFRATLRRASITAPGRLTLHSFRHGYASLLIGAGLNVV